jgi:transposase
VAVTAVSHDPAVAEGDHEKYTVLITKSAEASEVVRGLSASWERQVPPARVRAADHGPGQEGWMQCEEDRAVMHALHVGHGWSIAQIAREFDVNWRTAKRYAESEGVVRYPERERPAELSDSQLAHVRRRLAVCPALRATTLYREVTELGYTGSYPSFARRVRALRPVDEVLDPPLRFETDPGVQVQADWADCRAWLLGVELVRLYAFVAVLGYSRMVAVRFATDTTRSTTLRLLVECLDDLGGAPGEVLTDRDPAFVIGSTPDGHAVYAPEWIDLAATLGVTPKACKPYRAKTKGKVERMIRELKEDFLPWLTGQVLPQRPSLADYDALARRWATEVVATRRHRTTKNIVGDAWAAERPLLQTIPQRILASLAGAGDGDVAPVVDISAVRAAGDVVYTPDLDDYEAAL